MVTHYALAYPEVRFSLRADGRRALQTTGSGELRDAVAAVYGADLAAAMLPVGSPEPRAVRVSGLTGPPHVSRAGRGYISLFVNRRWIQNRRLAFAVEEAYQGMLMTGRRPVAVLNIELSHEEVDVNVHPTKAEVRFRDESAVFGALQKAVRAALLEAAPVAPAFAGGGPSSAAPALDLAPPAWTPPLWEAGIRVASRPAGSTEAPLRQAEAAPAPTPVQALPVLRVIGQFGGTYIIAEGPEGMYLIDQHAAHERVLYERFWALRQRRQPDGQGLLEPVTLDLSPRHRSLLAEQAEALSGHGLEGEPFGAESYLFRAVPRPLADGDVRQNLLRFLDVMLEEEEGDRRDRVAMSLACHGAIRAGKTLSMDEMKDLVRQLEETESPHTCPHGRPTMVHVSADLLAREFGRR